MHTYSENMNLSIQEDFHLPYWYGW